MGQRDSRGELGPVGIVFTTDESDLGVKINKVASYLVPMTPTTPALSIKRRPGSLPDMHTIARLLQLAGLAIPPLAMGAQLSETISTGRMLQFLIMAVGLFMLGYTIQRHSGGGQ